MLIWGSYNKTLFQDLERMHVVAAKITHKLQCPKPSAQVFGKSKVIYTINSHSPLSPLFQSRNNFYTLRDENKLPLPQPKTEILKRPLAYRGNRVWNLLHNSLTCKGFNEFKTSVKSVLMKYRLILIWSLQATTTFSIIFSFLAYNILH